MRPLYRDKEGRSITAKQYMELLSLGLAYRRIAFTEFEGGGYVSTIWLGMDHSAGYGDPEFFETMEFPGNDCERHTTIAQAREGHARMVAEVAARRLTTVKGRT